MLNKVILMGRLTRDPEMRYTQNTTAVCSFSIAVDRNFKGKTEQQNTDFIDIVAWRTTAEFVSKWFTKGKMIVVVGSLQIRSWQDKDGNARRTAEVVADEVYFGDSKKSEESAGNFAQPSRGGSAFLPREADHPFSGGLPAGDFEEISEDDDELPF